MTATDYVTFGGYGIMLWAFGYLAGVGFRMVKQVIEKATGLGS